jgi:nitrate/TMAO reductase-like tetraheme cytochrome c subunit
VGLVRTAEAATAVHGGEVARWGTALDWAIALTAGISALIVIGILASLFMFRGRQTEGSALWVHLLSLGVLPLGLLAIGNFATLEYAAEVQFCGSCHMTMKPYIDDLHDKKSESLASLHSQNRFAPGTECYSCHANYGVHGTIEAKLTGLRHVYKYNTGTYHLPLKMPEPFENTLCLKCHNGAKRFMAQDIHLENGKVSDELRSNKTECVSCHGPAHDIPAVKKAGAGGTGVFPPAAPVSNGGRG